MDKQNLFNWGKFKSHSGKELDFKIECGALTDVDLDCLAEIIASKNRFKKVIGIPKGGTRLAAKLKKYTQYNSNTLLIVDDVLTTGQSMNLAKEYHHSHYFNIFGVVIFARGECPDWVTPIFRMW